MIVWLVATVIAIMATVIWIKNAVSSHRATMYVGRFVSQILIAFFMLAGFAWVLYVQVASVIK